MPSSACDWSSDVCSSDRSEEHTSELQSRSDLVCRLLLEKKKKKIIVPYVEWDESIAYVSDSQVTTPPLTSVELADQITGDSIHTRLQCRTAAQIDVEG